MLLVLWVMYSSLREGGISMIPEALLGLFIIFSCVVLHELGHCLTARKFGINVPRILLTPIGGIAQFSRMPRDPGQELLITIAGPAVNFAIAGGLFVLAGFTTESLVNENNWLDPLSIIQLLFLFNLVMGVFNLLPIFPMDGGRIFRAAMASKLSYLHSTRIAFEVARVLALLGAVIFFQQGNYIGIALLGFVFLAGRMEYHQVRDAEEIGDRTVGDVMRSHFLAVPKEAKVQDAACFHPGFEPFDFVIIDEKGFPKGVVTLGQVKEAMSKGKGEDYLDTLIEGKVRSLQAQWPLNMYASTFRRQQTLHPVLYNDRVVGVVDTEAFWKILRGRNRQLWS
jgi:Zn-dependent protease